MKFIIIGLGNFGSSLAEKLTAMGHEIFGVDSDINKVEAMKEKLTFTMCLNSSDQQAISNLPVKETDVAIVCIGEDEGANLMTTALMKKMNVKRLISRAVNPLHETILDAMGITEIVHPEEETAERWANKLDFPGIIDSFELSREYSLVEAVIPKRYIGKKLGDIKFRRNHNILLLSVMKPEIETNVIGEKRKVNVPQGVASSETVLHEGDIVVFFGKLKNIQSVLKED
ncbi:MAG: TrkA family potassium uptake protein [Bacteroidales bacterium]